jgi:O-Antigen ligase
MLRRVPGATFWVIVVGAIAAFIAGAATVPFGYWMLVPVAVGILGFLAAAAWSRGSRNLGPITAVTPNLMLIALPTILATSAISFAASVYATAILALGVFWMRRSPNNRIEPVWPCAILPAIGLAIVLRPNYPSTSRGVLAFTLGCIVIAGAVYLSTSRSSALTSLIDGIGLFLIASVALRFIGLGDTQPVGADELTNSLTGGDRVSFPLSISQALTPHMAAVYLAALTPILVVSRRYRVPRLVAVAAAVDVLVLADRRTALIGALFLALCVLLVPRLFRLAAPWLAVASMIIPFSYRFIQGAVEQVVSAADSQAPWLLRPGEDPATLNGRDYIWSRSLDFFGNRVDWVHQMFGFGSYGHTASGVSANYGNMFGGSYGDRRLLTPHNSVLQLLFDGGWVIGIIFAATIGYMAWVLSRRSSPTDLAGLAMLTALSIVGITEVTLSPGYAQPTWWVLMALGMIVFSRGGSFPDQSDRMNAAGASSEISITAPNPKARQQRATA